MLFGSRSALKAARRERRQAINQTLYQRAAGC
jgi:hypothetical protein